MTFYVVAGLLKGRQNRQHRCLTKVLRIMRLAVIMLGLALQVSATGVGQQVSVHVKNAPIEKVFQQIRKQTGLAFIVDESLLKQTHLISVDLKNVSVETVLDACLKDQSLTYTIRENLVEVKFVPTLPMGNLLEKSVSVTDIQGRVTDSLGKPVEGASVMVKGSKKGTTTNSAGYFSLRDVDSTATLMISGANIETTEIKLNGRTSLSVTARIKISAVDEVEVIAYGTSSKRLNTGNVASIKGEEIQDRPVGDVMQAIQGKLPGVAITNTSPGVGAKTNVMVRGVNSISSGINPLIVVDGVIVNDQTGYLIGYTDNVGGYQGSNTYTSGVSTLNFVNPNDIESISVLKDADATGIYGSRGTNGVILITTKKASLGKTTTAVTLSTGWKSPTVLTPRMNTPDYLKMRKDAFAMGNADANSPINPIVPDDYYAPDLTQWSQTAYTDFTKMDMANSAPNYNAGVSMSGGNKSLNYVASGDYYKMYDNYMFSPYQERTIGRLQINHTSVDNKLNIVLGVTAGSENQKFTMTNLINATDPTAINAPNFPLYNDDGSLHPGQGYSYGQGFQGYNPYIDQSISANATTSNLLLNGSISYTIVNGLVAKLPVSYTTQDNFYKMVFPSTAVSIQNPYNVVPFAQHTTTDFSSINVEPQLSYNKTFSKLNLGALAGLTFLTKQTDVTSVQVNNPGSDDLLNSYASGQPTQTGNNSSEEKFRSVFARVNLDWDNKYVLNLNYRRDGSSRFGPNNQYANFASGGLAWIFSSESFVQHGLPFLSFGKLRGSYGTTGNNNIPDYQYLSLFNAVYYDPGYVYSAPLEVANYANPDVKWETTAKTDISIQLGFLNNRIMFGATWYRSITSDLLMNIPLAGQSGFTNYYGNIPGAEVQNTGWEFELTTQNFAPNKKVQWTTRFNLSTNANILKAFPNLASSPWSRSLQIGRAIPASGIVGSNMEMPYHFTGVDPSNGVPQFQDLNKDGVIDYNDYFGNAAWWGTSLPTIWGGLTNTISYKGFTFEFFFTFSNGIFSNWNFGGQNPIGSLYNPATDVVGNYWMKPGDQSKYPRLYTNTPGDGEFIGPIVNQYPYSTAFLYKGYYIRLKNVQLSYSLPANLLSKLKLSNALVYVSGENLAVYTPVKLYKDPETQSYGNTNSLLRTITAGIRFQF